LNGLISIEVSRKPACAYSHLSAPACVVNTADRCNAQAGADRLREKRSLFMFHQVVENGTLQNDIRKFPQVVNKKFLEFIFSLDNFLFLDEDKNIPTVLFYLNL